MGAGLDWCGENFHWLQSVCRRTTNNATTADDLFGECLDIADRVADAHDPTRPDAVPLDGYMRRSFRLHVMKQAKHIYDFASKHFAINAAEQFDCVYSIYTATERITYAHDAGTDEASVKRQAQSSGAPYHHDCEQHKFDAFELASIVLPRLTMAQKILLVQFYWQGLSYTEIGLLQSPPITKVAVCFQMQSAMREIRELLNVAKP